MWPCSCLCLFFWWRNRVVGSKFLDIVQLEFLFPRNKKPTGSMVESKGGEKALANSDAELRTQCVEILHVLGLEQLADRVQVIWNKRMRTTAGRAFWPDAIIELNPKLEEIAPEEVQRTLLHELAHLVAYARAGRHRISAHGVEWQQACADVGIPGERATHSLPLPGRKMQKKWRYSCPACGEGFDRVRKIKRYAGCYSCCKQHNGGYYDKKFRLVETFLG